VHDRKPKISKSEFPVRFQWDPDHDPYGNAISRRAIQIGIKGEMLKEFNNKMIFKIIDITDFVADQRRYVDDYTKSNHLYAKQSRNCTKTWTGKLTD